MINQIFLQKMYHLHQCISTTKKETVLACPLICLFIDRAGWDFPKYLQILKDYDIYKAEEDYLNIKFEEPPEIGEFSDIIVVLLVAHSNSKMYYYPTPKVILEVRLTIEKSPMTFGTYCKTLLQSTVASMLITFIEKINQK